MVAWRYAVLAAALLSASCTSVFDSYYSDSLEYLETQTDLSQLVGSKTIVAVHMQVLQSNTNYSHDALGMVVDTDDGKQTVAFYGMDLKKIKTVSQSVLSTLNSGNPPVLYPIMQDASGFYTGQIGYPFSGGALGSPVLMTYSSGNDLYEVMSGGNPLSQYKATHYDDGAGTAYPVLYDSSGQSDWGSSDDVTSIGQQLEPLGFSSAQTTSYSALNASSFTMLGAACYNKTYFVVFSANGTGFVAKTDATTASSPSAFDTGTVAPVQPKDGDLDLTQGWATATAAIIRSHSDNSAVLHAFSWSGKDLGSLHIASDSNDVAYAFHPNGKYWFVYDPANHRLSKYKAWW